MTQQYQWPTTVAQMKLLGAELIRAAETMGGDDEESQGVELVLAVAPAGTVLDDDGVGNEQPILTVRLEEYPEEGIYPVDPRDPTGGRIDAPTPPASAQPERDWELSCFYCNGSGHVFVKRQVAELATDVQEIKEDCEGCDGRGFNIAFEDIPGIEAYVKSCRLVPASAQDDAKDERQAGACPRCDGSGEITVMSDNSPDAHDVDVCCDHCQGSGAAVDAAKYLAAALSGEKYRHMQVWAEYRNFHRSLCARFGYGHDEVHFRRDLVSLEEAIAAKVAAPAAGDARDAARYRALRRKVCIAGGKFHILNLAPTYVAPNASVELDSVLDDIAASQQQEG